MSFSSFLSTLSPSFEKAQVQQSVQSALDNLHKHTLPSLEAAVQLWQGQKFKSKGARDIEAEVKKSTSNDALFMTMLKMAKNAEALLKEIMPVVGTMFQAHESSRALTYAKATVLRLIQASELHCQYSRRVMNYIYWLEADELGAEDVPGPKPAELEWMQNNNANWVTALVALEKDPKELATLLKRLPDTPVSEVGEGALASTLGLGAVDPYGLRSLSIKWNPFYLVGMMVSEMQADGYRAAEEEVKLLEFRLIQLQKLRDKQQDARLDKEIAYTQERVTSLHAKLGKLEKDYHV